jgi:hypothetical protein
MNSENIKNVTNQAIEPWRNSTTTAFRTFCSLLSSAHKLREWLLSIRDAHWAASWGEKGLMILGPLVRKVESSDEYTTEKESRIFGFRAVYVFDASQIDGAPLPTIGVAQGDPGQYFPRLEQRVREQRISLEYSARIAPAKGMSCGKRIILLPGMAPASTFRHSCMNSLTRCCTVTRGVRRRHRACVKPRRRPLHSLLARVSGLIRILQLRITSPCMQVMQLFCGRAWNTSNKQRIRYSILFALWARRILPGLPLKA